MNKTPEELIKELHNTPFTIERKYLPEPDYHLIALEQAGKLNNDNLEQLLGRAEQIEKWMREPKERALKARNHIFETIQKREAKK